MIIADFLEQLIAQMQQELPFVAYRKPNATKVQALLQKTDTVYTVSDYTEKGFVMAPFDDCDACILIPLGQSQEAECVYEASTLEPIESNSSIDSASRDNHIALVEKGIQEIRDGAVEKVVLSRAEAVPVSDLDPITVFERLLNVYPKAFVYCWYHPKVGLWLGATPENLLQVEGKRFKTMALAGTQEYKGALDVVWGTKEREEQQFVTDFIVENLGETLADISVSEPVTVKAGNLLHLKSAISGRLKSEGLQDVIKKLHPTPAVCGVPKEAAKTFILENEPYEREFYTGFLGELNLTKKTARNKNRRNVENNAYATIKTVSNLFVNLRCMQWKQNKLVLYLGGGITVSSNPQLEWEETVAKSKVMKKVLQ